MVCYKTLFTIKQESKPAKFTLKYKINFLLLSHCQNHFIQCWRLNAVFLTEPQVIISTWRKKHTNVVLLQVISTVQYVCKVLGDILSSLLLTWQKHSFIIECNFNKIKHYYNIISASSWLSSNLSKFSVSGITTWVHIRFISHYKSTIH